ncbi:hypothetical protein PPTG_25012, partial [Phytophthora nicotianae INRA-310]
MGFFRCVRVRPFFGRGETTGVSPRSPKAWEYGIVTGYTWVQDRLAGELFVCFGDEQDSVPFNLNELQDLA